MSTPILRLNKANITEGEVVTATCLAPGETGSLLFSFYDGSKEVDKIGLNSNSVRFLPKGVGDHIIYCSYSVFIMPNVFNFNTDKLFVLNRSTELFSVPTLKMSPPEVFQGDSIRLICQSERLSYNRLGGENLIYSLEPLEYHMSRAGNGVFAGNAKTIDSNYTCTAAAKGIKKKSNVLTIRPKGE
ncbi:hypothetical protein GOODEAATRI_008273 [Goodea atripinnis]|uniref:Ig-like domain-containing protein n=1 Tax=Goodea atripinnis TaxID=208336 RepID=A0ABV0PWL4_9TELE